MTALVTLTVGIGESERGVVLSLPGGAPATGQLTVQAIFAVHAAVKTSLRPPAGILTSASDLEAVARERAAGQALASLFEGPELREVRDALVAWQARAGALHLVIDARSQPLRSLPWELLAGLPPGRSPLAAVEVLRLQPAPPTAAPPAGEVLQVRLWSADPDEPVVRRLLEELRARLLAVPMLRIVDVPTDLSGGPQDAGPAVLHLVTHGRADLGRVGLHTPSGTRAADTMARGLASWSRGCTLAITDVCAAAEGTLDPADAPTWRLSMDGMPVVVGPSTRWGVDASLSFGPAVYRSLAEGRPVSEAIQAGRAALRQLALAHRSCRWWTPLAIVTTPAAARLRLVLPPAQLPGWPPAAAEVGPVLRAALEAAHGYLGVEHLVAAHADPATPLPAAQASLRPALAELAAQVPALPLAGPCAPSPRMLALGAELPAAFPLHALLRQLALVPWVAALLDPSARARMLAPPEDDGCGTLPMEPAPVVADRPGGTGLQLEVEAGPEDGRQLALESPGELIGRWDPGRPEQRQGRLLCDRPDGDRTLSRQHLRLVDDRTVELRGATRLLRGGALPRPVSGLLALRPGDGLVVGASTRLRVLG